MSGDKVKEYLSHYHLPQLLESLLTGLLYFRPEDPVGFLQHCLNKTRQLGGPEGITWDTFLHPDWAASGPPAAAPVLPPVSPATVPMPPPIHPIKPPVLTIPPIIPTIPPGLLATRPIPPINHKLTPVLPRESPTITTKPCGPTVKLPEPPKTPAEAKLMPPISPSTPIIQSEPLLIPTGPSKIPPEPPAVASGQSGIKGQQERQDKKRSNKEAGGPHCTDRPAAIQTQLSIDSDSDMTESSGLLQEVRPHPLIIFIIGGPGSGKGSQMAKLAHCYGLQAVSLDDLIMRQLLSHGSSDRKWEVIAEIVANGELIPQESAIKELKRQLIGQQEARGFIVDGFPRDINQALSFQEQIGCPDLVVLLACSNQTLRFRLEQRATRRGRLDDSSHALRKRLETFHQNIRPITRYYQHQDLLRQIDADREEEVVFADLSSAIREKLFPVDQSDPSDLPECSSQCPAV